MYYFTLPYHFEREPKQSSYSGANIQRTIHAAQQAVIDIRTLIIQDADYLWSSWDKPTRYMYHTGHVGIVLRRKKIAFDTLEFIRSRIIR